MAKMVEITKIKKATEIAIIAVIDGAVLLIFIIAPITVIGALTPKRSNIIINI